VRKRGIGEQLMARAEGEAKARSRTLLVLDTASGDAERLYERSGWQRSGVIPDYALWPGGGFCDTTIFWKRLAIVAYGKVHPLSRMHPQNNSNETCYFAGVAASPRGEPVCRSDVEPEPPSPPAPPPVPALEAPPPVF
jgi:hypothetical protein